MSDAAANTADARVGGLTGDYARFIILSGARTGSHMLAAALNSSPNIICFREVYNHQLPIMQYGVDGYDESSEKDKALRERDPAAFLHERIFCQHGQDVRAVGFKWHYRHIWGLPIIDTLTADKELRVVHLRRRNGLRAIASLRIAERTGAWLEEGKTAQRSVGLLGKLTGLVHRRGKESGTAPPDLMQKRLTLSVEECRTFFDETAHNVTYFEERFAEHPLMTVYYEELVDGWSRVLSGVQSFLGAPQRELVATTRHQNPEPLRELIENFDELRDAFRGTPHEAWFE